jgi:hypothetical protein
MLDLVDRRYDLGAKSSWYLGPDTRVVQATPEPSGLVVFGGRK